MHVTATDERRCGRRDNPCHNRSDCRPQYSADSDAVFARHNHSFLGQSGVYDQPVAIRALVFDLGGVLIDFGGVESVHALSEGRVGPEEFSRFWSESVWADRLYRGVSAPDEFASGAVQELDLGVSATTFLAAFCTWLRGPYPGAFELLRQLRRHHLVACLSNTNVLDVERFRSELQVETHFDRCFFSPELGLRKPDRDCYLHVVKNLGLSPGEVLFVDDSEECVAGAQAAGLVAHQCVGFDAVVETLAQLHLIDSMG